MSFEDAYSATLKREGGYRLHTTAGDRGGATYAGISRTMNGQWPGWAFIDRGETPPTELVRQFYFAGYWQALRCDEMPPEVAASLYDFAVNTSAPGGGRPGKPSMAVKLAQLAAGAEPDGVVGPKTLAALSNPPPLSAQQQFVVVFALAKLQRYADICNQDASRVQARTFLLGWINRILGGLR